MTRTQALTLAFLGVRWRLLSPTRFEIFLAGQTLIVSGYAEALSVASNYYGRL